MARKEKQDLGSVMLAPNSMIPFDDKRIPYGAGVFASHKIDGIRLFIRNGVLLTRAMLTQPNRNLPAYLSHIIEFSKKHKVCFDGELFTHDATHHGALSSIIMSHDKPIPASVKFYVFDMFGVDDWMENTFYPFKTRITRMQEVVASKMDLGPVEFIEQRRVFNPVEASAYFREAVEDGHEGIMLRAADSEYKKGRCGHKGAWLLKFKAVETDDGKIIEVVQRLKMKEGLKRTTNAWGRKERPTVNDDNYEKDDMVGSFRVRLKDGTESEVMFAAGFADHALLRKWWKDRKSLIGKHVECVMYPGAKDGIRSGRVVKWRPDLD